MVLGHISDSDIGQLQTEDARLKWGKQFAESFLEEPLRVFFNFLVNIDIHHTIIFCITILSHFSHFSGTRQPFIQFE